MKERLRTFWRKHGIFTLVVFAILAARWSIVAPYKIPSGSMEPTLLIGDRLLVNKAAYDVTLPFTSIGLFRRADPQPGEILLFDSPENRWDTLIKRVIGVPGDELLIRDGFIWVNGQPLPGTDAAIAGLRESSSSSFTYLETSGARSHEVKRDLNLLRPQEMTVRVPADHYFVMGDNRDNSNDSRFIGLIPRDHLRGRAEISLFRLNFESPFPWISFERSLQPY